MAKFELTYKMEDIKEVTEKWPRRTRWATDEALRMAGGHMRKKIRTFIERGGRGWKPLSFITRKIKGGKARSPLYKLAQLVRWKFTGGKNPRVQIGFFTATKRGKAAWNRRERERFKDYFGGTPAALAKKHEFGARFRVTPAKRRKMAAMGAPLKKATRFVVVPARPMIGPIWATEKAHVPEYVGAAFWKKMTGKGGTYK